MAAGLLSLAVYESIGDLGAPWFVAVPATCAFAFAATVYLEDSR